MELYNERDDAVTEPYEGELATFGDEWAFFFDYYCSHGYYRGVECPDCDTSCVIPYFQNRDFGDETTYDPLEGKH